MKSRLFITTGNYSLLNCLALIKSLPEKCTSDTLYILSFQYSNDFKDSNLKIASIHSFNEIIFINSIEKSLIDSFNRYDNVYFVIFTGLIHDLLNGINFKNNNIVLFNEATSFASCGMNIYKKSTIIINNFLNKFSFPKNKNISYIDYNKFTEISNIIQKENNLVAFNSRNSKSVLIVGHYNFYSILGHQVAIDYYKRIIDLFGKNDFEIYFKPHPRELSSDIDLITSYLSSYKINYLASKFPLESYKINFSCVAGSFSNLLITLPYFKDIPAIHFKLDDIYSKCQDLILLKSLYIVENFTPKINSYENILNLSVDDFNMQSKIIYKNFIKKKIQYRYNLKLRILSSVKSIKAFNFFRVNL